MVRGGDTATVRYDSSMVRCGYPTLARSRSTV